tara:strand:- start:1699 stop:2190 length:492 start_codon:yes stop_codon:yes gene_type:complete
MFKNLPFDTTHQRLRAFKDYADSQPGENTQIIEWELKAFECAKEAFIETYSSKRIQFELEDMILTQHNFENSCNNKTTQTIDESDDESDDESSTVDAECNKALVMMELKNKKIYSEIKDVEHDDEGYPFVKTANSDSDSGLSSDDEEIPVPTKTKIVRRKPKN